MIMLKKWSDRLLTFAPAKDMQVTGAWEKMQAELSVEWDGVG
jgi:hypothetical protein